MAITITWKGTVTRQTAFEDVEEQYKTGVWLKDGVEQGLVEIALDDSLEQTISDADIIQGLDKPWLT